MLLPKNHPVVQTLEAQQFIWGSAQYDSTAALYIQLCLWEAELGRDEVLHKTRTSVGKVQPFEGDALEGFKEALCVDIVDREVVGNDTSVIRKTFEHVKTVTEALAFLKSQAWDLWCAVPYISFAIFPEVDLDHICAEHKLGTFCWLFKSYGYVENDEPFKGWDT